jgi:hypothetical protein
VITLYLPLPTADLLKFTDAFNKSTKKGEEEGEEEKGEGGEEEKGEGGEATDNDEEVGSQATPITLFSLQEQVENVMNVQKPPPRLKRQPLEGEAAAAETFGWTNIEDPKLTEVEEADL